MTATAFCCTLLFFFAAGFPFVLFLPRNPDGRRILLMPFIGLSVITLLTTFLSSLGMTGREIAALSLPVIGVAALGSLAGCLAFRKNSEEECRVTLRECLAATPALCAGLLAVGLITWPLFYAGYENYWGFANPDEPFYMTIIDHLDDHAFSQPPSDRTHTPTANPTDTSSILGLCYIFPMLSEVTGISSFLLFGVVCAAMVFLVPLSSYLLSRSALGLNGQLSLVSSVLVSISAVTAQMFYLHSLGALSVAAVSPAVLALTINYPRNQRRLEVLILLLLLIGMLFSYYPGFAVSALLAAIAITVSVLKGRLRPRSLLKVMAVAVVIASVTYWHQAFIVLQKLIEETFSRRLAIANGNELLLLFDRMLTEQFVSIFWGLRTVGDTVPLPGMTWAPTLLLLIGAAFWVTILKMYWRGNYPLLSEFQWSLAGAMAVIAAYFVTNNGYGVYKLVTWLTPLFLIALVTSCLKLRRTDSKLVQRVGVALVFTCGVLNAMETVRLGVSSLGGSSAASEHSAPQVSYQGMRTLSKSETLARGAPVLVAFSDPVLQRWAIPFLRNPAVALLPQLSLDTEDSDEPASITSRHAALSVWKTGYVLYPAKSLLDILPRQNATPVWHNSMFAMYRLEDLRDLLVLGAGWYRHETMVSAELGPRPFRWLRKRAELLFFNPSPGPHRLIINILAGFGNPSPVRHLELFCNGKKFDEIAINGYSRVLTRPFTPDGKANDIEILIEEDARPLPRTHPLWKPWVPSDPRRLNVAVFEVRAVDDSFVDNTPRIDFHTPGQFDSAFFDGVYPDRWIGRAADLQLGIGPGAHSLLIRGVAPDSPELKYPLAIRVYADRSLLQATSIPAPGKFDIAVSLRGVPLEGHTFHPVDFSIEAGSDCFSSAKDPRCLSLRLDEVSVLKTSDELRGSAEGSATSR